MMLSDELNVNVISYNIIFCNERLYAYFGSYMLRSYRRSSSCI